MKRQPRTIAVEKTRSLHNSSEDVRIHSSIRLTGKPQGTMNIKIEEQQQAEEYEKYKNLLYNRFR